MNKIQKKRNLKKHLSRYFSKKDLENIVRDIVEDVLMTRKDADTTYIENDKEYFSIDRGIIKFRRAAMGYATKEKDGYLGFGPAEDGRYFSINPNNDNVGLYNRAFIQVNNKENVFPRIVTQKNSNSNDYYMCVGEKNKVIYDGVARKANGIIFRNKSDLLFMGVCEDNNEAIITYKNVNTNTNTGCSIIDIINCALDYTKTRGTNKPITIESYDNTNPSSNVE